jgi:hypothetical protein
VTVHLKALPQTVSQLVIFTINRLEADIGPELIGLSLSLLVSSQSGEDWSCE